MKNWLITIGLSLIATLFLFVKSLPIAIGLIFSYYIARLFIEKTI